MEENRLKVFLKVLLRKALKISALSLVLFCFVFFYYFMDHADDEGLAFYYKIYSTISYIYHYPSHFLSNYRNWFKPQPIALKASADNSRAITLKWNTPENKHIKSYLLEKGSARKGKFKLIARLPRSQTKYIDSDVFPASSHYYRLRACNLIQCSNPAPATAKTLDLPPSPPVNLTALAVSPYEVKLTWENYSPKVAGFEIYRMDNVRPVSVGRTGPEQTSFFDCPLIPGKVYTYLVAAFDQQKQSADSPAVNVTLPDLERIGESHPLPIKGPIGSLVWNGKEWAAAYAEEYQNDPESKDADFKINTEIYFQRLDPDFKPIGERIRISFDPCTSDNPMLAWNGAEYGVAWSDSRGAGPDCYDMGDSASAKELFFARISVAGKRLGPEVKLLSEREIFNNQRIFWSNDHWVVVYTGPTDITYLRLDGNGKILDGPKPVGESTWMWDVIQAGEHFGVSWISSNFRDRNILYFLDFDPASKADIKPVKIAKTLGGKEGCLTENFQIGVPSVFWTGSNYGVCYKNCTADTAMALISPETRKYQTIIALPARSWQCSGKETFISEDEIAWLKREPAQCVWNGSEIALLSATEVGGFIDLAFLRFSPKGQPIDKAQYLGKRLALYEASAPKLYWHKSYYFAFYQDSLILIKP